MDSGGTFQKTVLSYAAYDWAASPLPTLHATFVFAVYFTTAVMPEGGTVAWAWMTALAGLAVAVAAPFSGVIADRLGWRKKSLFMLTIISVISGARVRKAGIGAAVFFGQAFYGNDVHYITLRPFGCMRKHMLMCMAGSKKSAQRDHICSTA